MKNVADVAATMTTEQRVKIAAQIIQDATLQGNTQGQIAHYLINHVRGPMISETEYQEALNIAGRGVLFQAAF